jgi:hypothetical protein
MTGCKKLLFDPQSATTGAAETGETCIRRAKTIREERKEEKVSICCTRSPVQINYKPADSVKVKGEKEMRKKRCR